MRIALCLSGLPRALEEGYKLLYENIIKRNNPDIFIHIWTESKFNNPGEIVKSYDEYIESINFIMKIYKPVSIRIDKYHILKPEYESYIPYTYGKTLKHVYNMNSMYESRYLCNILKCDYECSNKFIYDSVLHSRFDLNLIKPIELEKYDMNKLNIYGYDNISKNTREIMDAFAFSSSKNMDQYFNIYNNLPRIYSVMIQLSSELCSEIILKYYINDIGLEENYLYDIMDKSDVVIRKPVL
jgi:hypothetical protein